MLPPSRTLLLAAMMLSSLAAGCFGQEDAPAAPTAPPVAPSPSGSYAFQCEGRVARTEDVCVTPVRELDRSLQEPFLLSCASRGDLLALAANGARNPAAVEPQSPAPLRQELYLSTDHGRTWARSDLPVPVAPAGQVAVGTGDPSLVCDSQGVMHATGVLLMTLAPGDEVDPNALGLGRAIFHARSTDGGKTWEEPALVEVSPGIDRNWITLAPDGITKHLVWFDFTTGTGTAATSLDGTAWAFVRVPDCTFPSPVVFPAGVPTFACRGGRARIVQLVDGAAQDLASVPGVGGVVQLVDLGAGRLAVASREDGDGAILVALSADGGRSWGTPVDLRGLMREDDAWTFARRMWMESDPQGNLHVLVKGGTDPDPCDRLLVTPCDEAYPPTEVHLILDGQDLSLLKETRLTPMERETSVPVAAADFQDDFHAIVRDGDALVMAWRFDRGIDVARLGSSSG